MKKATDLGPGSRYELLFKIASGGMATVYVARLRAGQGVRRLVAVKRAHPHLAQDTQFRRMLVAEAQVGAQIHHANVVAVQDVEELDGELLVVMDYVEGAALSELLPLGDLRIATRMVLDAAAGIHAAHEAKDDQERPLGVIHRDVTPHNLLVGLDGVTRVTDFGIAKSAAAQVVTSTGAVRGKLAYMAPEYLGSGVADKRIDVFGLGVVLWEALTGARLFQAPTQDELIALVERCRPRRPSEVEPDVPPELEAVVMTALEKDPDRRFATAAEFRDALESAARATGILATHAEVAAMVAERRKEPLATRRAAIRGSSPSLPEEAPATSTFSRELAQRDEAGTTSLPVVTVPPTSRSPWLARMVIFGAAVLVVGVGLKLRPRPAPPAPVDAVVAPPPAVSDTPEPAISSVPSAAPSVSAPPPPPKRPRPHPRPTASVEPPVAPVGDHSKPNPYLNK